MRYARALLKSATALKIEDSVCQDMMCLGRSYIEVPQLRTAIATPMLQPEKKELLLVTAAGTEPTELPQTCAERGPRQRSAVYGCLLCYTLS